jgi:hypothetical protein
MNDFLRAFIEGLAYVSAVIVLCLLLMWFTSGPIPDSEMPGGGLCECGHRPGKHVLADTACTVCGCTRLRKMVHLDG